MHDTVNDAVVEIVGQVSEASKSYLEWARHHPEASVEEVEERAVAEMRRYGQLLLGLGLEQQQVHEALPDCPGCGRAATHQGAGERTVVSLTGEVTVNAARFRCRGCGREVAGQLRASLTHGCTPGAAALVATFGALHPFREAESLLGEVGLRVSDNTVTAVTHGVGNRRADRWAAEAEAVWTGAVELMPERAPERLYLEADGFKARAEGAWHDVRAGCCFVTARRGPDAKGEPPRAQRLSCAAIWDDAEGFARWFYVEAQRRGVNQALEVVVLVDGAPWLEERLKDFVPPGRRVVTILDWYHACENLAKAVRAVYPADTAQFEASYAALKEHLWEGRVSAVARGLRRLWDSADGSAREEVRRVWQYVRGNRRRMRYPRYRRAGYYIGSGHIESLCKQLGRRVKGADRTWSRAGLRAVTTLLCQRITTQHSLPRAA